LRFDFAPSLNNVFVPSKNIRFLLVKTRQEINDFAIIGYNTQLLKIFQTFYYTRAVTLIPSLRQYADPNGKEPGTLRGSQWSPCIFIGDRDKGLYGGTSLFFNFQNRRANRNTPLISSLFTLVSVLRENRFVFSFWLNGIGAFGIEQFGQGLR
jgi:hypothetical protein